jgi:hypothetical protein
MRHFSKAVAACVMASLCFGASAAEKRRIKTKSPPIDYSLALKVKIPDNFKLNVETLLQARAALAGKLDKDACEFQLGGVCAIDVPVFLWTHPVSNIMYCGAAFPELVKLPGSDPNNSDKTVVWRLVPTALSVGDPIPPVGEITFYSEKNHGIILLTNGFTQMHSGKHGDGTEGTNPPNMTAYQFKNKHKVKTAEAVYLPIVVRTDAASTPPGKVSVCATPDPRIMND